MSMTKGISAMFAVICMSLFYVVPAMAGNGAQHGYVEVTLTDVNGNAAGGSTVLQTNTCTYVWTNLTG